MASAPNLNNSERLKHMTIPSSEVQTTGKSVGRELGRGAYGRVFTVKYCGLICAAKEIHSLLVEGVGQQQEQSVKEGFIRECQHCSVLNHPNIVRFMGVYYPKKSSTIPVMIMELMDESLCDYIKKLPKNAWMKKGSILLDVAEGLSYLHAQKPAIVHRDLSPNNILLKAGEGEVSVAKIGDLGVAKIIKADSKKTQNVLTKVPGTQDFMPPECFEDEPVYGVPLDLFSYGGIMLFVVTCKWPSPIAQVKRDSVTNELVARSEVERRQKYLDEMTGYAEWLRPLVESCLSNIPSERPTIRAVSKQLKVIHGLCEEVEKLRADNQNIGEKLSINESLMEKMSKTCEQKSAESERLYQVIHELREEVEKLRADNQNIGEKLSINESLMGEMSLTLEQKLAESEGLHQVIRELHEEVEKLRQLLKDQGGPSGTAANPADSQDIIMLREKLSISENLMQEMSKTWEQKLVESEKLHQERQKALEDRGISVKSAGIGVQRDKFYFVNLNADPIMSELLVFYLKLHTKIGRPDAEVQQDIQLKGLGIQPEHCVVEVVDPEVFITPLPAARTLVNGKIITERTKLCHGYRVLLGNNHFFRLSCPKRKVVKSAAATKAVVGGTKTAEEHEQHSVSSQDDELIVDNEIDPDEEIEINETTMNYDFAMKEVILNELNSDPNSVYQQMKQSMEKQHVHEKQDVLEQQKVHYECQLAELHGQLQDFGAPVTTTTTLRSRSRSFFSPMLETQWEKENSQRVMDTYFRANTLVREANMLSQALEKDTQFKVVMQIPPSLLSPILMSEGGYNQIGGNEIATRVLQRARGTDSVWGMETLEEKVVAMRELFQMQDDGKYPMDDDTIMDPFFDIEQHVLLGVANIFTQCLYHRICHVYDAPIIGPTGKVCGSMKMSLERIQVEDVDGDDDADGRAASGWQVLKDPDGELVVGSQIEVKVHVMEATGLPSAYCHFVFAQYKFWGQSEPVTLAPLQAFSPAFGKSDKLLEGELKFDHTQVFTVEVTEDFLDYLDNGTLSVEVYGHRRTGFTTTEHIVDEDGQNKSFPERCCEVMKNLEMWVGILELNDQGSYVPVSIEERKDVKTGGVYVIRQGQSRRIEVKVAPVSGSGNSPLQCSHITSVAIGSIYVRKRTDEPLDSYQDIDLDRLRGKWADALMRRRDYLDKELRKIMEKKGRTKVDNEKEQELIDQWTMLLMERSALLQPKPGSGVPGAPTRWKMSPGMEPRVTTLYLDLNDDMLTPCDDEDPMAAIATAPLLGEKDESMINLALQKSSEPVPEATASWDSSVHDAPGLNCPTANIDRVYAILRVSVMLHHPPGIELVLRKRICLRVIKKVGFGTSLMKFFSSGPSHTETGAMYEVVTGIPKLEGMFRPPKIPSLHPSFVEVEENENVVEKFKEGMMSVRNILALDRLKQEVCLKEKLVKAGQLPRHHTTTVDNSNQSEDTTATPPPQEEFPNPTIYEESEGVSPNLRVLQNSPQYSSSSGTEEHRPIISPLLIPDINVTAGTPPLTIGDIGAIVRQNEITDVSTANNPGGEDVDEEPLGDMIGLSEVTVNNITEQQNNVQGHSVKRQGSERKSRPNRVGNSAKRRSKSSERLPSSDRSLPSREGFTPTSERLTRRSIDTITPLLPVGRRNTTRDKSPERRDKSPEQRNRTADKPPLSNDTSSDSDDASSSAPHKSAASSLKSSASSVSSSVATAEANNQPSCVVGEKVMVDTPIGFKFGKVKFVGTTEFAAGEWIGVALERPNGKHDGTVKGVKYFKCKDKHGLFVRPDKIIRDPAITGLPNQNPKPLNQNPKPLGSPVRQQKGISSSPSTKRKVSNTKI